MNAVQGHSLKARKVKFDLSNSPVHWLPGDVFSSHLINGIHLLLPAGELWFCRVYNKALPFVTDPLLREEVQGFIRQEGVHAQAHRKGEAWLQQNGYDIHEFRRKADWMFEQFLGENPFALPFLKRKWSEHQWLIFRVGVVAAIEHFTGLLGDWCMNNTSWDQGDPVVADLFRWHLAEEVEHRTVAFDVYEHLCQTQTGFYLSRQAIMAIVFPLFLYFIAEGGRSLGRQDSDPKAQYFSRRGLLPLLLQLEREGRRTNNVPTMSLIVRRTLRWLSPRFHPEHEGNTEQALAYIARSPAAQAAV
ncbi:MAG: metal-dependent hydrolase [Gammaproteobacteria bacterium HGW-Gammaproteobacteria-14]|nr:MAG: metal-dependent hydrolase [Gammaproteobacteria bacterium HGW-Gammaproteobacteria-14]